MKVRVVDAFRMKVDAFYEAEGRQASVHSNLCKMLRKPSSPDPFAALGAVQASSSAGTGGTGTGTGGGGRDRTGSKDGREVAMAFMNAGKASPSKGAEETRL